MRFFHAWTIGCLLGITTSARAEERAVDADTEAEPYALVVSGGISLGVYEAGLNWALVTYMRHRAAGPQPKPGERRLPRLVAVTGASAGSVNAVVSAIEWCREGSSSLDNNLFGEVWLDLDVETLMPKEYGPNDALLSRKPMDKAIKALEDSLADAFRPGCAVEIGIMVSRIEPKITKAAGLDIPSQRFLVPLRLVVDGDGRASFRNGDVAPQDPLVGNVIYLPTRGKGEVDVRHVADLLQASSAFPLAFAPKELVYAEKPGGPLESALFVDGGVFDNVPLGAARALAEGPSIRRKHPLPWMHYIYMDPDRRRAGPLLPQRTQARAGRPVGLMAQGDFLTGFVTTARNYELQSVLRFGQWNRGSALLKSLEGGEHEEVRKLIEGAHLDTKEPAKRLRDIWGESLANARSAAPKHFLGMLDGEDVQAAWKVSLDQWEKEHFAGRTIKLTDRAAPLAGSMFGNFGAFFDEAFRDHDFLVGVYDAAYNIASHECRLEPKPNAKPNAKPKPNEVELCIFEEIRSIISALKGGDRAIEGSLWLDWEHLAALLAERDVSALNPGLRSAARHAANLPSPPSAPRPVALVARALAKDGEDATLDEFKAGLGGLKLSGLARQVLEADSSLGTLLFLVLSRQRDVEADDAQRSGRGKTLAMGLGLAAGAAGTIFDWDAINTDADGWRWRGSNGSIPLEASNWWHLFPNYLGLEFTRWGVVVGWEPQFRWKNWAIRFGFEGALRDRVDGEQSNVERDDCFALARQLASEGAPSAASTYERCGATSLEVGTAVLPQLAWRGPWWPFVGFLSAGPTFEYLHVSPALEDRFGSPDRHPFALGLGVSLGIAGDKVRIAARKRLAVAGSDWDFLDESIFGHWVATISLNDLGGLLYWLSH